MDRIMSTSIIIFDQNFNANYVDIMVSEPSVLFPPAAVWGGGGIEHMVRFQYYRPFLDFRKIFIQQLILKPFPPVTLLCIEGGADLGRSRLVKRVAKKE